MNAEIISIGTEILLGEIVDTNSNWIAKQLRENGINLFFTTAVGDNLQRITDSIVLALSRSDIVITTGGLGPTVDDMTRQAVATATGRALVFHQHLLDGIAKRFEQYGVKMSDNNRQQAYAPADAILVDNPVGSAPIYIVESEQGIVISLPGVPREMKHLMTHNILPYLREKMGIPAIIKAKILKTAGIGESSLDDKISDFMTLTNPTVGLAAHSGQTDIRITARADTAAQADAMIAELETKIRERVDHVIFGTKGDDLPTILAALFAEQQLTLVSAEAGTKGTLTERLKPIFGQSLILIPPYPDVNAIKASLGITTSSLKDVGSQLAASLCEQHQTHYALIALQDGDRTALTMRAGEDIISREIRLGADGNAAEWASNWGMGYIWRSLKKQENP